MFSSFGRGVLLPGALNQVTWFMNNHKIHATFKVIIADLGVRFQRFQCALTAPMNRTALVQQELDSRDLFNQEEVLLKNKIQRKNSMAKSKWIYLRSLWDRWSFRRAPGFIQNILWQKIDRIVWLIYFSLLSAFIIIEFLLCNVQVLVIYHQIKLIIKNARFDFNYSC